MEHKNDSLLVTIWLHVSIVIWFSLIEKSFLNKGFCLRYVLTVYVTIKTLVFLELMSCPKI